MPTLILSHRYSQDSANLWRAAVHAGWDVERIRGFQSPASLPHPPPVLYGETLLADALSGPLGLRLLQPTDDWLPLLPQQYRLRTIALTTLGEARLHPGPVFLKPVDEKWFSARVYERGEDLVVDSELDPALPVLQAQPVRWEVEFRAFVLNRAVAALSPYIRAGSIAQTANGEWPADDHEWLSARDCLARLLADEEVALPPAVVVDVGRIADQGWAVVEANACWASGLCGCDPRAVLPVLQRASVPGHALSLDDRRWLRPLPEPSPSR